MRIEDDTIIFKSDPENFYNECRGAKCNTVRRIIQFEEVDSFWKFQKSLYISSKIRICLCSGERECFERQITDIAKFEGCESERSGVWIISWRHE